MTEDANLAYNRNRYQSSILPSAESDIRYSSISSTGKAVAPNSFSTTTPISPDISSKVNRSAGNFSNSKYSSVSDRAASIGIYGSPVPSIDVKLSNLKGRVDDILSDHVAVVRLASHLSVLMIAGTLLVFSQFELPKLDISLASLSNNITNATLAQLEPTVTSTSDTLALVQSDTQGNSAFDIALPRMVVPFIQSQPKTVEAPTEIRTYIVQPGDTIFGIAQRVGLNPETLQWANPTLESNPDLLSIGDQLKIPPTNGVLHIVGSGDTLNGIAQKYKVSWDAITGYASNNLTDAGSPLVVSQELFVPGGVKPFDIPAKVVVAPRSGGQAPYNALKGSGSFGWPATGQITQYYWNGHRAIDVASWVGNSVKATDSGYVVEIAGGWSSGYGLHVIIDHGNGFQTLYAHLSSAYVTVGENVSKGQQIGAVGNTGNSTGPHLHFEVRYQGVGQNPLSYLR